MPGTDVRQNVLPNARRIVVKVGTNAICESTGRPDEEAIAALAQQIAEVMASGVSVTMVASGAIGAGVGELNLDERPKTTPHLQAAAAVGQGQLMRNFHDIFARYGVRVAQVLVTRSGFEDHQRYLNTRNTLAALEEYGALAIINENDTVAIEELRYGENDVLAAIVANMLGADLLVLLTVVDGVLSDGEVVDVITQVDDETMSLVSASGSKFGTGGMATKLQAADMVIRAGEAAVIANARTPNVLTRLLAGERLGTVFMPADRKMSSKRRWIGLTASPVGRIIVDSGAARALKEQGKSLLPSGVTGVEGMFAKGDMVAVLDDQDREIARGLTNYSSDQVETIKGLKTDKIVQVLGDKPYDEVIHRNNMAII
ncbi:MAG: glutamate 5-kinase [Phycisphaerae bacterium]|jgi:glutamate 5-kinase|nr:glutamate 5-kinase [Phycisphaerae bacterium]MDP7286407.1 glutamate 5-kinase [Phycisphaerae bacterium]